jgi:hypothetical protein
VIAQEMEKDGSAEAGWQVPVRLSKGPEVNLAQFHWDCDLFGEIKANGA